MQIKLVNEDEDLRLECSPEIFDKQRYYYHLYQLYLPPTGIFEDDNDPNTEIFKNLHNDLEGHFGYGYLYKQWVACDDKQDNVMTTEEHYKKYPNTLRQTLLRNWKNNLRRN